MYLDDINRKIDKQQNQPKFFERHDSVEIKEDEVVIPFIDKIQMLYVKNTGEKPFFMDAKGMVLKLFPGEEKTFTGVEGSQIVLQTKEPGAKAFVGQSLKENTRIPKDRFFIFFLIWCLAFSGCSMFQKEEPPFPLISKPKNYGKYQPPKTPDAPAHVF